MLSVTIVHPPILLTSKSFVIVEWRTPLKAHWSTMGLDLRRGDGVWQKHAGVVASASLAGRPNRAITPVVR